MVDSEKSEQMSIEEFFDVCVINSLFCLSIGAFQNNFSEKSHIKGINFSVKYSESKFLKKFKVKLIFLSVHYSILKIF